MHGDPAPVAKGADLVLVVLDSYLTDEARREIGGIRSLTGEIEGHQDGGSAAYPAAPTGPRHASPGQLRDGWRQLTAAASVPGRSQPCRLGMPWR